MICSPSVPYRFPRTTGFTEVPPYPYARRTRALDTDAAGRRVGGGIEESDHDGFIGDKDVLPAYDNAGGPPKYRELALELSVMPPHTPGNDTGNTGDAGTREPEAETRSSHQFTDSDQENGDIPGEPETLSVPNAVHVRQ
ncbi:hypothetical protein DXG01_011962 [Tephrocybe rancida]|nr:hypothetical protein DXG01_011962 [Tephrocybe rancida]